MDFVRKSLVVLNKVCEKTGLRKELKPLVVGRPRSGFSLLTTVLYHLMVLYGKIPRNPLRNELQVFIPPASEQVYKATEEYFKKYIKPEDLLISGEFQSLVGGPKWLSKEDKDMVCVRKYVGMRDWGDFLLVISLPKFAMEYFPVMHSHDAPGQWLEDPYYRDYEKFSNICNPMDTLTASVFSINALTSEYIQRHISEDTDPIREELALYKLTDLNFFEGLIPPLLNHFKEFLPIRNYYHLMKWEDLITEPEKTIQAVARDAGIIISSGFPRRLWNEIGYRNMHQYHKHHFWKTAPGNWKNYLVNEHLDVLKGYGFDEFLEAFGYEKIQHLDTKDYTPFQKKVAEHLSKGQICEFTGDKNVFTFDFNKSNFRSSKFDFVSYPGKAGVYIERSTIKDEQFFNGLIDALVAALTPVNESLNAIYAKHRS